MTCTPSFPSTRRQATTLYASSMRAYSGATTMRATTSAEAGGHAAQPGREPMEPTELRARRRALGLTQAELAERLAVSANTVARWERRELRVGHPRQVARTLARLERINRGGDDGSGVRPTSRRTRHPAERPPYTVIGRPRHNLPAELSSFVGREVELARLANRLSTARLLTLVGPGGVGKTRLALQVGSHALESYQDGVWLVELAPLGDPRMVANAVAAALGIRERGRIPLARTLADTLRDRRLLLVLDNCEHLLDACATLAHTLLRACPHLTILATSREPLRVVGEMRSQVPPLALSDPDCGEESETSEAVQLFIERAREVQADFDPSKETRGVVASICARLDGLPLAIELAAARTGSIPVRGLLQQLQSAAGGLPVLIDGPRDAPTRQQTLRATIAWSYDLLTVEERVLFRRLAPFRGCTTDDVESVCIAETAGPGQTSVALPRLNLEARDSLASLVTRNLLLVEDDGRGKPWYSMLEMVREFALERLEGSPEAAAVWRRYAWYYLRLVEQSDPGVRALRQDVFLDRVEWQHANIRAALDWCQTHGYAEASLRLAVGLSWLWSVRGYMAEGRARLEVLLARFPLRPVTGARARVHAEALDALGHMAAAQGDLEAGAEFEHRALAIFESLDHAEGVFAALDVLAVIARKRDDLDAAAHYLERSLAKLRVLNAAAATPATLALMALTLSNIGRVAHDRGDEAEAVAQFEEAERLIETLGDTLGAGLVMLDVAEAARDTSDYERAQALAQSALRLLEREDDRRGVALALAHLGSTATARQDFKGAYDHLSRSLRLNHEMSDPHGLAFVIDRFAVLASVTGQPERAMRLTGAAETLREQGGVRPNAFEQQYIDQQIEAARLALGRMADTALNAGRGLGVVDAIAEALATASQEARDGLAIGAEALSTRERQVAMLVGYGYTNRRIAARLIVGEATVATHVRHVLTKLQLSSRAQVAVWATRHGLLDEPRLNSGVQDASVPR